MGRPRRPTHLKLLAGEREDRINRGEPIPDDQGINRGVNPPRGMSTASRKIWDRLAPDLIEKRVLTAWDVDMFRVFCDAVAVFHECRELMGSDFLVEGSVGNRVRSPYWQIMKDCADTMIRIGGRFGLTPADRAGLDVSDHDGPRYGAERILDR